MQTFLPYPDMEWTAICLDMKRLGKQRVEARQILNALDGTKKGWSNHPAVRMWRGHRDALIHYGNTMIEEWVARGYNNTMLFLEHGRVVMPAWYGDADFHASHRSNLLRKDFEYYSRFLWKEPDNLPYIWPNSEGNNAQT